MPWLLALIAGAVVIAAALVRPQKVSAAPVVELPRWKPPLEYAVAESKFDFATSEQQYGLPPGLLSRIAYQESRYRPESVSVKGAAGLMQFIPATAKEFGIDPYDSDAAIDAAGKYLRQLYDRFESWPLAVAAYNAGPGNVEKYGGVPPFEETRRYVASVSVDMGWA